MAEDQLSKFQQFASKAVLADQTLLVNTFLLSGAGDKDGLCKMYGPSQNLLEVSPDAEPVLLMKDMISNIEKGIAELDKIFKETKDADELKKLDDQRKLLEETKERVKNLKVSRNYVFEWLLVPEWMGDELINLGEVVYRCMGCTFWGISTLFKDNHTKEDTLLGIFEELHNY